MRDRAPPPRNVCFECMIYGFKKRGTIFLCLKLVGLGHNGTLLFVQKRFGEFQRISPIFRALD